MYAFQQGFELHRASSTGVLFQRAFSCSLANRAQLAVVKRQRIEYVAGTPDRNDLRTRRKKPIKTVPAICQDRRCTRSSFKQPARRTEAVSCHCPSRDVQRRPAGTEERGVQLRWKVTYEINVVAPWKVVRI